VPQPDRAVERGIAHPPADAAREERLEKRAVGAAVDQENDGRRRHVAKQRLDLERGARVRRTESPCIHHDDVC
jgi:hypothetical protein